LVGARKMGGPLSEDMLAVTAVRCVASLPS
jgi:hypothetical protein